MIGKDFRRRLMGVGKGEEPEPAPEGVVWYDNLVFSDNTAFLNTGVSVQGVEFEWEVEWKRTSLVNDIYPFEKDGYDTNRDLRIGVRRYYGPTPYCYYLYHNSTGTGINASPGLNSPSTFVVTRNNGEYTLSCNGASYSVSAVRDAATPLIFSPGSTWTVRRSIITINGVIVQSLRPCTYYGEAGMWDVVNEVFIGNAAQSGNFTVVND